MHKELVFAAVLSDHFIYIYRTHQPALAAEVVWTPTPYRHVFPQAGHSFRACVVPHLRQFRPLSRFWGFRPRDPPCLLLFGVRPLLGRVVFRASTSLQSDLLEPFMLMNSLCASSEDREISTAFCRLSCGSRSSCFFRIGLSVKNTILSLITFSGAANSHDKASVRRCVKNSSKVCPAFLEEPQNWYLENTIRFCPANSFMNFAFTWSNLFLSSPLRHLKWLYRSNASGPTADNNMAILVGSGFFVFSLATRYNSNLCIHPLQFSEGVPLK